MSNVDVNIISNKKTAKNMLHNNFDNDIYENNQEMLKIYEDYNYFTEKNNNKTNSAVMNKLS